MVPPVELTLQSPPLGNGLPLQRLHLGSLLGPLQGVHSRDSRAKVSQFLLLLSSTVGMEPVTECDGESAADEAHDVADDLIDRHETRIQAYRLATQRNGTGAHLQGSQSTRNLRRSTQYGEAMWSALDTGQLQRLVRLHSYHCAFVQSELRTMAKPRLSEMRP